MAAIHGFRSRADLLRRDQRERVRGALAELVEAFDGSSSERRVFEEAIAEAARVVDRRSAAENLGSFVMLYPAQNRLVVEYLSKESKRPFVAARLWAWLFEFASPVDGEILVTREGLAERVGATARSVDTVLKELVEFGALIRRREPEPGKRGRGVVRYYMNPRVGTQIADRCERAAAQQRAPLLELIGGTEHKPRRRAAVVPVVCL